MKAIKMVEEVFLRMLCPLLLCFPLTVSGADRPVTNDVPLEKLVLQLGAAEFKEREKAEKQLIEMGDKAVPVLTKNNDSSDPEISMRVRRILSRTGNVRIKALFKKGIRFTGSAASEDKSSVWPCVVGIKSFDGLTGKFKGQVEWLSLNSLVAIEGTLTAGQLVFKEVSYIRQGNSVLNCVYTFDLTAEGNAGGKIHGTWIHQDYSKGGDVDLVVDESLKP